MVFQLNLNYVRTTPGLVAVAEVIFALIGGIVNIVSIGLATGLLGFTFWSNCIISGILLILHVINVHEMLSNKFALFIKAELGYLGIWFILYIISAILSFISFGVSGILCYVMIVVLLVDFFIRFRAYRSRAASAGEASAPGAAEQG